MKCAIADFLKRFSKILKVRFLGGRIYTCHHFQPFWRLFEFLNFLSLKVLTALGTCGAAFSYYSSYFLVTYGQEKVC